MLSRQEEEEEENFQEVPQKQGTEFLNTIQKDILSNPLIAYIFAKFNENSGITYTALFILLVFFFGNLIDYILVNQTDAAKSAIFIKYSVRWWAIVFCTLFVLNIIFRYVAGNTEGNSDFQKSVLNKTPLSNKTIS